MANVTERARIARRRFVALGLGLLPAVLAVHVAAVPALARAASEEAIAARHVKAAYLHRFAAYVEWPDGAFAKPESPLCIGVWGSDDLAEDLAKLVANRLIEGRRVEVKRVRDADPLAGLHMLFVSRDHTARFAEAQGVLPVTGVLVVTESANGLRSGAVINFVMSGSQIRFEISLATAERYSLRLSSRLVAIALNSTEKGR